MRHWFFMLDVSLRFMLFPGRELEDVHRFHHVFCYSFLGTEVRGKLSWGLYYSQVKNLWIFIDSISRFRFLLGSEARGKYWDFASLK